LRFARTRPLLVVAPDLRRAAEYRAGRRLCDDEVRRLLDAEWDALVKRWVALGRWIARLDEADAAQVTPRLHGTHLRRSDLSRHRMSVGMRASWARRKAI